MVRERIEILARRVADTLEQDSFRSALPDSETVARLSDQIVERCHKMLSFLVATK